MGRAANLIGNHAERVTLGCKPEHRPDKIPLAAIEPGDPRTIVPLDKFAHGLLGGRKAIVIESRGGL